MGAAIGVMVFMVIYSTAFIIFDYVEGGYFEQYTAQNLKLIKTNVKKNKIDCCFLDIDTGEKYIIHIRKFLLRKKYIPEEFLMERHPKTCYYNYIKSKLQNGKKYAMAYFSFCGKNFVLSLEQMPE